MDPNNPVVRLCAEGIQAEMQGRAADARALYTQAWDARRDAFEACIAAHYLARHQETPEEAHRWNAEALTQADAVPDERVRSFYPSLLLNMGHSCETLGDLTGATRYYALAHDRLADAPEGPYGDVVRHGVAEARKRVGAG